MDDCQELTVVDDDDEDEIVELKYLNNYDNNTIRFTELKEEVLVFKKITPPKKVNRKSSN